MRTRNALLSFGLTRRQADLYLLLRSKGPQTLLELSRSAQIPRATVYDEIEKLKNLSVVRSSKRNRQIIWESIEPRELLSQFQERFNHLASCIPLLEAIAPVDLEGSSFEYFVGLEQSKEAQRRFYELLAKDKVTAVRSFGHPDLAKRFPKFIPLMIEKRRRMGISTQLIVPATRRDEVPSYFDGGGKREMRFMPPRYQFNCNCVIGGAHILFIVTNTEEPTVVLMKSLSISSLLSACHALIWDLVGADQALRSLRTRS